MNDGLSMSRVQPCAINDLRVKVYRFMCVKCRWIHGRGVGVKMVTPKLSKNFACSNLKEILDRKFVKKELMNEVETVK